MNRITVGLALAALAAGGVALAGQPGKDSVAPGPVTRAEAQQRATAMFDRLDANKDGKLDQTDREARRAERRAAMFDQTDANKDGQISRAEFVNFRPAHRMDGHDGKGPEAGAGGPGMDGHRMGGPGGGHHRMGRHGGGRHGMGGMMMRMADADKDGAVTRDEFTAAFTRHFDQVDANKDGTVTPEERRAAHDAMRQRMHDRTGQPGAGTPPPQGN